MVVCEYYILIKGISWFYLISHLVSSHSINRSPFGGHSFTEWRTFVRRMENNRSPNGERLMKRGKPRNLLKQKAQIST